jgi:hypothetical protein
VRAREEVDVRGLLLSRGGTRDEAVRTPPGGTIEGRRAGSVSKGTLGGLVRSRTHLPGWRSALRARESCRDPGGSNTVGS